MKKSLLFLLFLTSYFCKGQTIQNYSGKYENGKITYKFYENSSFERIYHGPYVYSGERNIGFIGDGLETIKGNFSNNFQDGAWDYSFKDIRNEIRVSIKGNYKNGLMEGTWTKTITDLIKNSTTQKMIANFKDGKLIGDFYFSQKSDLVQGKFNENSHYDGKWSVKYKNDNSEPCEIIYEFNDGILTFVLNRNIASGEIIYKSNEIKIEKFYKEYFCNYCSGSDNPIGYIYFITTRLLKNDISNSYSHNYGSFDDGSAIFNRGLKEVNYNTLKTE